MRRAAVIGALAVLVVGAAWILSTRSHHVESVAPRVTTNVNAPEPELAAPLAPPAVETARTEPQPSSVDTASESLRAPATTPRLHGIVVVEYESGIEDSKESGTLRLVCTTDQKPNVFSVDVVDGKWSANVDLPDTVEVAAGTLGGRYAVAPHDRPPDRCPADGFVALHVKLPPTTLVHVRDAASGAELAAATVVTTVSYRDRLFVPSRVTRSKKNWYQGHSPIRVSNEKLPNTSVAALFVRADGYAWCRVACTPREGGDVFAELYPSSDLLVELVGDVTAKGLCIRLDQYERSGLYFEEEVNGRSQVALNDICAGQYTVLAQIGQLRDTVTTLAVESVTLVAGVQTKVRLSLSQPEAIPRADLSGILAVPSEWGLDQKEIELLFLGKRNDAGPGTVTATLGEKRVSSGLEMYDWSLSNTPVGRYEISIEHPPFGWIVDLPPGGARNVRIELPPPADVSVQVIDPETKQVVEVDGVGWASVRPPGSRGGVSSAQARWNSRTRTYDARCPLGEIRFTVWPSARGYQSSYRLSTTTATVHPGLNTVVLPIRKTIGIAVTVMDGTRVLPESSSFEVEIESVAGTSQLQGRMSDDTKQTIFVSEPGQYRVRVTRPIPGYLMPVEQIVDLAAGTMTDVVIRLTRKP